MNGKKARQFRREALHHPNDNTKIPLDYRYREANRKLRIEHDMLGNLYRVETRTLIHCDSTVRDYKARKAAHKRQAGGAYA